MSQPDRKFTISSKSTHEWLATRNPNDIDMKTAIAIDLEANGREIAPEVDWIGLIKSIKHNPISGALETGRRAVALSEAPTIRSVALGMEWNLHDDPMVYVGGIYFLETARALAIASVDRAFGLSSGAIRLTNEDQKTERIKLEMTKSRLLRFASARLEESLGLFAASHLDPDEKYLQILRVLPFSTKQAHNNIKTRGYVAFKNGEIERAHKIFVKPH